MPWRRSHGKGCGEEKRSLRLQSRAKACARLRKELVAQDVGHQRQDLLGLVDLFPRRHTAKAVVNAIPNKLGLIDAWLQLWCFARIGSGAMTVGALVMPDLFPLRDHQIGR